jgi:hypothetical protein
MDIFFIILCVFTPIACLMGMMWYGSRQRRWWEERYHQECHKLRREMRGIYGGLSLIHERIRGMGQQTHTKFKHLSVRQEQAELRTQAPASYSHAAKMAEMGVSLDEIMIQCGLHRGEAELVNVLYKKSG